MSTNESEPPQPTAAPPAAPPAAASTMAQVMSARVTWGYIALCALALIALIANGADPMQPAAADLLVASNYGPLTYGGGEPWRLVTSSLLHYGVIHFVMNALFLLRLGPALEQLIGPLRFAAVLVVSALGSSIASVAWTPVAASAGASGALFGVAGAWLVVWLFARERLAPSTSAWLTRNLPFIIVANLAIGAMVQFIDNAAHVGGLVTGMLVSAALLLPFPRRLIASLALVSALAATVYAGIVRVESAPQVLAQRALLDALGAESRGDQAAMLEHLDRALAADPANTTSLWKRMNAHVEGQRWALAERDAAALLQLIAQGTTVASPEQLSFVRQVHILARANAGDGPGAVREWEEQGGVDLDAGMTVAMCPVLARHATRERALAVCDAVVAAHSDDGMAWSTRAQAREVLGDLAGSLADAQKAVELEPSAVHLNNLAWYELRDGKLDDAAAHIEKSLELEKLPNAYGTRGWIRHARGDREGALADLRKAQELVPDVALDRGMLMYVEGKTGEGVAVWQQVLAREPWQEPFVRPWIEKDLARRGPQ